MKPYIGITDFTHFSQVRMMSHLFERHPYSKNCLLHVGVMVSYKTLYGLPTKWENVWPSLESLGSIFSSTKVYNCLHYADYETNPDLAQSLCKAVACCWSQLDAIQLDLIWPSPGQIALATHAIRRHLEVILQLGGFALEQVDNDPEMLVDKLLDYEEVIDRVLLDKSMGRGRLMEPDVLLPFIRAIRKYLPSIGIGVAGGLGPDTLHLVEPLIKEFPDLSIDACSRLRHSHSALDPIDWSMAANYVAKALTLYCPR